MSGFEARKQFVQNLENHPLVDDVNWTRDGYQTVLLELGDGQEETDA